MENVHVGDTFLLSTEVSFGALSPEELDVEIYYGPVNVHNEILCGNVKVMTRKESLGNNRYRYECELECCHSGRFGLTARITPAGDDWDNSVPGFICWPEN